MNHVQNETCVICGEFKPHYCAAIVQVTRTRLSSRQGQRTKFRKTVIIQDRMPPYDNVRSIRTVSTGR
jgi:NMD protein affecting ribosome stability and mRNA decay